MFQRIVSFLALFNKSFRVFFQIIYGAWRIGKLPTPIVAIFGGSRLPRDIIYFHQAHALSQRFIEHDISVITGGGQGAMEAVSCGAIYAKKGKGRSIGIGVRDLGEKKNECVQEYFVLDYFFARKWLLTRFANAFVVFPGGFGTLDELAEILTLIQTRILKTVPVILIGKEYWHFFMKWVNEALKHDLVQSEDIKLFVMTDDLDEAFSLIYNKYKENLELKK